MARACSTGLYQLEKNWRDLVEGSEALPERVQQQQDAIWELFQTELAYIRMLTVVKDVSISARNGRLQPDRQSGLIDFFSVRYFFGTCLGPYPRGASDDGPRPCATAGRSRTLACAPPTPNAPPRGSHSYLTPQCIIYQRRGAGWRRVAGEANVPTPYDVRIEYEKNVDCAALAALALPFPFPSPPAVVFVAAAVPEGHQAECRSEG